MNIPETNGTTIPTPTEPPKKDNSKNSSKPNDKEKETIDLKKSISIQTAGMKDFQIEETILNATNKRVNALENCNYTELKKIEKTLGKAGE